MIIKKFLTAGGNSTALVYDFLDKEKKKISRQLLKEVEQVGFVEEKKRFPCLEMMGNELCINGTLAFASNLNKKGKLLTSGVKEPVKYFNRNRKTSIILPLSYKKEGNIILLEGIGFILLEKKQREEISKKDIIDLAEKYNLPAFGLIIYEKNKIFPYIYVKSTDSFVNETACGSGSIAFSIFSGFKNIIQPTGKLIEVNIKKDKVVVSAEVKECEIR